MEGLLHKSWVPATEVVAISRNVTTPPWWRSPCRKGLMEQREGAVGGLCRGIGICTVLRSYRNVIELLELRE